MDTHKETYDCNYTSWCNKSGCHWLASVASTSTKINLKCMVLKFFACTLSTATSGNSQDILTILTS